MKELSLVISQPDEGRFLQKIGWNKEEIKNAVTNITKQYTGLTYTEDQIQDAKKDRAALNSLRKDISDRRIVVKKALMAPYEVFEAEVKEVVAMIDEPIAMIDKQLIEYEEKAKEVKKTELKEYFVGNVGELSELLTFDMIFNPKWLNKTATMKSCKEEITAEIDRTAADLKVIDTMIEDKYKAYAEDFYFRNNRNMTVVISEVGRMKKIDRKAEEDRTAKEEAERLEREQQTAENAMEPQDEKAEEVCEKQEEASPHEENVPEQKNEPQTKDPFVSNETDNKIYKASFEVIGTKAQIFSVREFMIANGIHFGRVVR